MELEELKQNWNIMEERLGRLEMDQRQQLNNKVVSKVKKVQDRVLRRFTIVVICLPFFCWYIVHNQMCDFSMSTWVLLFLFVAVIIARQFTWMLLLRKIDCLKMTVREVCLAESRFRMSFKVGIAVSVLCAVPLLASMIWDMSQMGDRYILIGAWTALLKLSRLENRANPVEFSKVDLVEMVDTVVARRVADRNSFVPQSMERDKRIERGNNGFAIVILKK